MMSGHAEQGSERLSRQIAFITEVDKLKGVLRKTSPIGIERRENSAEHSWQTVLTALILAEHANEPVDLLRVLKMLALHDIVEVDVLDTFHYDKASRSDLSAKEEQAARRLFGLLPEDQMQECLVLWHEFEARQTPEARFAVAVDRLMAFILNRQNNGGTWREFNICAAEVRDANAHIAQGADLLWEWAKTVIAEADAAGLLADSV